MSKPKFTPGPWHVEDNGLCVCDSNRVVLFLSDRPYGGETDRVDTNLIAAAPDMYDALKSVCIICQLRDHETDCKNCRYGKVLRKARGESEVSE
mgnify:CR=1 FL=1